MAIITKINNLTNKSWKSYTGPNSDEEFKQKNMIFGYNGRGKSSLAFGIVDQFLSGGDKTDDNYRLLNAGYLNESLVLKDLVTGVEKIKGIPAIFGKKDVKIEANIRNLKGQLVDIKTKEDEIENLKKDIRKDIDAIHERRKGTARIQKKSTQFDIQEVVNVYMKDLEEAKKIEPDESKLDIQGDDSVEKKLSSLNTITISQVSYISKEEITEIANIFKKADYDNVDIPSSEIIAWIDSGLRIHGEEDKKCKFCGGHLDYADIKNALAQYKSNQKQQDVQKLEVARNKLIGERSWIQNIIESSKAHQAIFDFSEIITRSYNLLSNIVIKIEYVMKQIDSVILEVTTKNTFSIDSEINSIQDQVSDCLNCIVAEKDKQIESYTRKVNNQEKLVKGAIGLEIRNSSIIMDKMNALRKHKTQLTKDKMENSKIDEEIKQLDASKSATSDFALYINEILEHLDINLKLDLIGQDYIIKHVDNTVEIAVKDISEGEKNLLCLLFFYYEMFADNRQADFKREINLIILDDPIFSVDDVNRIYILEMVNHILNLDGPQVFVLTHSWEDFHNICYHFNEGTNYAFREIKKDKHGNSKIVKINKVETPYKHNFGEIFKFTQNRDTVSITDCEIYHYPNIMRQVLENFLKFKIRKYAAQKSNEKEIGRVLFNKEWIDITTEKRTKLGQLLNIININSHESSRNPDEVLKSAQFLMNQIEKIDKRHFDTNKE